jgi:ribonuclease P protein component
MWQRLVHSEYFVALLAQPQRWRSAHFAIHHVPAEPKARQSSVVRAVTTEISTAPVEQLAVPVDKVSVQATVEAAPSLAAAVPTRRWWAAVVPKRHAKRAVTRNLIERQVLAALQRQGERMPAGQWLVRLRSPWSRDAFRSADSLRLRAAVSSELDTLFARCSSPRSS